MMLLRSAQDSDLDAILHLSQQSGVGITTLPKDKELLKKRLSWSSDSYKKKVLRAEHEYYFFVLEDQNCQKIVGTSAIEAKIGCETPFYSYKISKHTKVCHPLKIRNDYQVLNLVNDNQGCSELCTLFLEPQYRKNNNGLLLSRGRFLFMAQYPNRFDSTVIAEMRGLSDEKGQSPFWNSLGFHFFHMSFAKADRLTLETTKQFITDLMPRVPIYIQLLSVEAQEAIGKPHQSALPAMTILLKEGFRYNHCIDIFDAGPTIEAPISEIKTIKLSRVMMVKSISDEVSSDEYLLANTQLDFQSTINYVVFNLHENTCTINKETASLLKINCGDSLRISPIQVNQMSSF